MIGFTKGPWIEGRTADSVIALSEAPQDGCADWYGGFVVCESVDPKNRRAIQSTPLLVRALARLLFDPNTQAFEEAHAVLAHALGFEGDVPYPDLDRAAHALLEPIAGAPELPRVLSSLEVGL